MARYTPRCRIKGQLQSPLLRYVFPDFISLLLNHTLSLETCFGSMCSLDVFYGSPLHPQTSKTDSETGSRVRSVQRSTATLWSEMSPSTYGLISGRSPMRRKSHVLEDSKYAIKRAWCMFAKKWLLVFYERAVKSTTKPLHSFGATTISNSLGEVAGRVFFDFT